MRKLYEATGAIAYAVERNRLIISGGFHSVSLIEAGRRRVGIGLANWKPEQAQ